MGTGEKKKRLRQGVNLKGDTDKGCLFIVATPIGNLGDISERAKNILASVDLVAAEDTRRTRKLLSHLGIKASILSCHEHNELKRVEDIVSILSQGKDVALVCDAGTPGLSDPGSKIVKKVREAGFQVIPVPGASAITAALSVSGIPADSFFFRGFLPSRKKEREKALSELKAVPYTLVFFEAPHRIRASLLDMIRILGDRKAVLARELTKIHETITEGTLTYLLETIDEAGQVKGEITLVVEGTRDLKDGIQPIRHSGAFHDEFIAEAIREYLSQKNPSVRDFVEFVSKITGQSKKKIYDIVVHSGQVHERK